MKDMVFCNENKKQFEFDESVACVFDDMLDRSIPLYEQNIQFLANLIYKLYPQNAVIVDLGCSTANTLLALYKKNQNYTLYGYDNAKAMLKMAQEKSSAYGANLQLFNADILSLNIPTCDILIANYMLQFIRPIKRDMLVKNIYNGLNDEGYFIFSEKIICDDKKLHKILIDLYMDFKKQNGYSEFEISQKREALENVLVPYTEEENKQMIFNAGFSDINILLKWGNFCTYLAKK